MHNLQMQPWATEIQPGGSDAAHGLEIHILIQAIAYSLDWMSYPTDL